MTTNNEEKTQPNQAKEDCETLKEKSYSTVSEYLLNYLHFSEEKHKNKHKSEFMNALELTFKMGSINFTPNIVKSLVIMQPTIGGTILLWVESVEL